MKSVIVSAHDFAILSKVRMATVDVTKDKNFYSIGKRIKVVNKTSKAWLFAMVRGRSSIRYNGHYQKNIYIQRSARGKIRNDENKNKS